MHSSGIPTGTGGNPREPVGTREIFSRGTKKFHGISPVPAGCYWAPAVARLPHASGIPAGTRGNARDFPGKPRDLTLYRAWVSAGCLSRPSRIPWKHERLQAGTRGDLREPRKHEVSRVFPKEFRDNPRGLMVSPVSRVVSLAFLRGTKETRET